MDRAQIIEDEAEVIRDCPRRALAGDSVKELANDLNARGIATMNGGQWTWRTLKVVLISARISGRREYRPTDSYEQGHGPLLGEITATGCWPAIITEAESDRLCALLTSPAGPLRVGGPTGTCCQRSSPAASAGTRCTAGRTPAAPGTCASRPRAARAAGGSPCSATWPRPRPATAS